MPDILEFPVIFNSYAFIRLRLFYIALSQYSILLVLLLLFVRRLFNNNNNNKTEPASIKRHRKKSVNEKFQTGFVETVFFLFHYFFF